MQRGLGDMPPGNSAPADRFLAALDPEAFRTASIDGGAGAWATAGVSPWPDAIPRLPADGDGMVDAQLLDAASIAGYLDRLRTDAGGPPAPLPPVSDLAHTWTAASPPLLLAEFLAYKSALAYRTPREIQAHFAGRHPATNTPYAPGVTGMAFFDGAVPAARPDQTSTTAFLRAAALPADDTQALAFAAGRTGYVILRGTETVGDLGTSLHDAPTDETYSNLGTVPQTLVGAPRPARHTGFAIAWGAIAPDVEAWVREQLRAGAIDRIVLSGHSLGGALAILAAYQFAHARICPVHAVITFGAPKVAGRAFKEAYENPVLGLKDRTLRLEAADDMVTILDRRPDRYHHVGHVWRLTRRPLRPWWQMLLFAPLDAPGNDASRGFAQSRRMQPEKEADAAVMVPHHGDNRPPVHPRPTWSETAGRAALALAWFAVRRLFRAWAAHSVERHYALYLSTLSYRRIRAHHVGLVRLRLMTRRSYENETVLLSEAFRRANGDLANHLAAVRGRHPKTFRALRGRPVRVASFEALRLIEKRFPNYLA